VADTPNGEATLTAKITVDFLDRMSDEQVSGTFSALTYRLAKADAHAHVLRLDGTYVDPRLLEPLRHVAAGKVVDLVMRTMLEVEAYGADSPEFAQTSADLKTTLSNLFANPYQVRVALVPVALRLLMHERLRGADLGALAD
jgi:hypothetical protein